MAQKFSIRPAEMFYKPLAKKLRADPKRVAAAREARKEFKEGLGFSDVWLACMIFGFVILGRSRNIKSHQEIYMGIGLFTLCFFVYLALKHYDDKRNRPLDRYLDKLD